MTVARGGKAHWERAWSTRSVDELSWYQEEPEPSLGLITGVSGPLDPVIDVGGGASGLAGALLAAGYRAVTVLDLSAAALAALAERLGERASRVTRIEADVLEHDFSGAPFAVWHDRAVFHFLTDGADRLRYREQLNAAVRPGGHAVVGTFSLEGPERCSGLPVLRYDAALLAAELGQGWEVTTRLEHEHVTPGGKPQAFTFVAARRR